jgi:hypothetical protein
MSSIKSRVKGTPATPFMADFQPLESLWMGTNPPYPSEYSARWAVRKLRDELASAKAVALHRSRLLVHPKRFAEVAEQAAIQEFSNRSSRS